MPRSSKSLVYVENFDQGLRTDVSADKAPPGSLVKAENVRWIPGGGFHLRPGNAEVTAWTPGTSLKIDNMHVMREFDIIFVQSGTKIFHARSKTLPLYSVGLVLTSGYRCQFKEYNATLKYSNGTNPYGSIAMAQVKTQFTDASSSIAMQDGYGAFFRTPDTGTFTVDSGTDLFTSTAHGLQAGDRIAFWNSGGALPGGLAVLTEYFVLSVPSADTFTLSATSGGATLDITSNGSGTNSFTTGIAYCKGQMITYTTKSSATITADTFTNALTSAAHGLQNGNTVTVSNSGGALPTGLSAATIYFVVNATTNTFQLSASLGGSAIDITGAGSGTNTFNGGDFLGGTLRIPSGTYEVGEILTQTSEPVGAPKATVIESVFEKMMASGVGTAKHVIFYSRTADPVNATYIDDFSGSGADTELFGKFGAVTAMKTLLTKMYVAKDRGIEAWTGIDSDGIPVRQPFTDAYGIVNADCLVQMGDRLAMFTTLKRFKTIEPDTTGADPDPIINPYFDSKIEGTLRLLDDSQTVARMGYNERDTLMRGTALLDGVRKTLVYDTTVKNWSLDTGTSPNCWVEFQGRMFYGSATTDKVYEAETGFRDGNPGGTAVNPRMDALTPQHFVGDRRRKAHVGQVFLTGLIKPTTTATVNIIIDGGMRTFTLDGSEDYVDTTQARPLGREYLGRDPLGFGGEDPALGFAFSVGIDVNADSRSVQISFVCQGNGFGLQIDSYEILRGDDESSDDTQADLY